MKGLVTLILICTISGIYTRPRQPLRRHERINLSYLEARDAAYKEARRLVRFKVLSPFAAGDENTNENRLAESTSILNEFENIENAVYNIGSEDENLVEGDIMLTSHYNSDAEFHHGALNTHTQVAVDQPGYSLWPDKRVPWRIGQRQFSPRKTEDVRVKVKHALEEWANRSCVTFPEISNDTPSGPLPFIEIIRDGRRCWSNLGQVNTGRQELSLGGKRCLGHGVIMHEFAHAMGFGHEQSRPDRDEHVNIMAGNIIPYNLHNFQKESYGSHMADSTPYDVGSVLHYHLQAFKRAPARTIVLKNRPDLELLAGQRDTASWYDEVAVNKAYDCADGCEDNCQNGGYVRKTDGRCICYCPPNIGGDICERVSTQCGETHLLASGETITTVSQNYPQPYNHEECSYLYTAPAGNHLTLEFTDFNLPEDYGDCPHPLEIKSNLIGQDSHAYCGSLLPEIMSTASSVEKDKLLLVFYANDVYGLDTKPEGGFSFKVTAVPDQCVNDPCHGAPCSADEHGNYKCDFLENAFHCDFESGLHGQCSRIVLNHHYDNKTGEGQAWSIHGFSEYFYDNDEEEELMETIAAEGKYFIRAQNQQTEENVVRVGTMSIIPHQIGGQKWCLDFKYIVNGSTGGYLKMYKAVNGEKGDPIFTGQQTKSEDWTQIKLTVDGSDNQPEDMVEMVFEATVAGETIGVDDIKFTPGQCSVRKSLCDSYPCGTHQCIPTDYNQSYKCVHPSKDVFCGFEDAEDDCSLLLEVNMLGDEMNFTYNTGSTPGYKLHYPQNAHSGVQYVYLEASVGSADNRAHLKIRPFAGQRRKLSLWYYAHGSMIGSMNLYRAIDGEYPGTKVAEIFKKNQGRRWKRFEIVIDNSDLASGNFAELIIEVVHGPTATSEANRGDILIDDISYTLINE